LVKVKFLALAIGAGASQHSKFTGVPSAARAVISASAGKKLVPTFFAQVFISFADAFAAIDANCRPKKMVYALQSKSSGLSDKGKSSFGFSRIHTSNYINRGSD
jgi:hypothetical protein